VSETVNIVKNEKGKVITAQLAYTPYNSSNQFGSYKQDVKYSSQDIKRLLSNHEKNSVALREMSDYLYITNGTYRRLVDTTKNIVSFEYLIEPSIANIEKLNTKSYQKKYAEVKAYLADCILDITVDDILFKTIKYGRYSAYDRGTFIQPLPLDYTRIIGVSSDGNPVLQFNFDYFDQFPTIREREMQLNGYDPLFKKMYMDYKKRIDDPKVNFSNEYNWRTLPHEKTYTIKIGSNLESSEGIGLLYGSIDDIQYYDELKELDRGVVNSQRRKIIVQQIPVDKEGNSILGEEEIIQSHENLKALLPPNVGCLTVLGGTKFDDIPLQLSALEKGKVQEVQSDVLMNAGIGEGALKGGNFSAGVLNVEIITNSLVKILGQIQSIWFNRKFKKFGNSQFQFRMKFLGITSFNRDKVIAAFDGLLDKGGSLSHSIAARGMDVSNYIDIVAIEDALEYKDKFKPLQTSHTISGNDGGRPSEPDLSNDNTVKDKTNGGSMAPRTGQ